MGPVIVRNTTDLGYYLFDSKGSYFYESEYDTFLTDGDVLVNNTTAFLMEAWQGTNNGMLLAGPFYEVTHAVVLKLPGNVLAFSTIGFRPKHSGGSSSRDGFWKMPASHKGSTLLGDSQSPHQS